jgi:UPF0716 protein FxsA
LEVDRFFKLFFLFTLVPVIELWLLIRVGSIIGVFPTIGVVILTGIVGAWMARIQGLSVISELNTSVAQGKVPGRELINAVLVFVGGALLLTPGFVTDILGFSMIMPGTRGVISAFLMSYFSKKVQSGNMNFTYYSNNASQKESKYDDGKVIDAERIDD